MAAPNVDIVFVIDTSFSMQPCFDQLRVHLEHVITPLTGHVSRLRLGLVGHSASRTEDSVIYDHRFLCAGDMDALYGHQDDDFALSRLFTSDPILFSRALLSLTPHGDEEMLVALDIAADFPFGPLRNTKRVIILLSDEPFGQGPYGQHHITLLPELMAKLAARRILLFAAMPDSEAIQQLGLLDGSLIALVNGGDGLRSVDFDDLLRGMAKSISVASLQSTDEPVFKRALFGQDQWPSTFESGRQDDR